MSGDIVQRLRTEQRLTDQLSGIGRFHLSGDAADEIVRLRAARERLNRAIDMTDVDGSHREDITEWLTRIEADDK